MKLVFAGTPGFAVPALDALHGAGHELAGVFTQPDRPAGRGRKLQASPVALRAEALGLPLFKPEKLHAEAQAQLRQLAPAVMVVVAYGLLLPRAVLDIPPLGCINIHASLLPRWRGAAPIQRAIMAGDPVTGVQVMRMTPGLDEGPILASVTLRIDAADTAGTLHDRLSMAGAECLAQAVADVALGCAVATPQAAEGVTYARKIRLAETRIRWERTALRVDGQIRGLSPFPGAWFEAPSERGPVRIKALLSRVEDAEGPPGLILDGGLLVGCGAGAVRILRAQREGRGPVEAAELLRGFPIPAGARIG